MGIEGLWAYAESFGLLRVPLGQHLALDFSRPLAICGGNRKGAEDCVLRLVARLVKEQPQIRVVVVFEAKRPPCKWGRRKDDRTTEEHLASQKRTQLLNSASAARLEGESPNIWSYFASGETDDFLTDGPAWTRSLPGSPTPPYIPIAYDADLLVRAGCPQAELVNPLRWTYLSMPWITQIIAAEHQPNRLSTLTRKITTKDVFHGIAGLARIAPCDTNPNTSCFGAVAGPSKRKWTGENVAAAALKYEPDVVGSYKTSVMKEWGPRIVKSGGEHALAGADYFFHRVEHILFEAHTTLWLIFGDKELLYILTRAFLRFVQLLSDGYWDGEPDSEEIRVTLNEAIQEQLKTLLLLREEAMREAELDYEANDDLDAAAENIAIAEIVEFLMFCINGRPKVQRLALLGFLHSDILLETLKRQYKGDQMEDKAEYPGVPPNLIAPYSWHKDMLRGAKRELSVPWARIKDVVPLTTEPVGYFSLDFDDNIPLQNILRTFHGWKQGRSGAKRTPWESIAVDERTIMWIPSILSLLVDLVDKNPEEQQKLLRRWSELIPDDIDAHDDPFQLLEAVTLPLKRTLEPDEIASFDHDWDSLRFHLIPMQLFPKSTSALLKRLAVPQSCLRFEMPLRAMEVQWRRSQFRTKSSASFLQWFAANNVRLCPGIVPSEGAKIGQLLLEEGSLPGTVHYPWQSTRRHRPSATEMLAQMPAWSGDTAKERLEDVLSYALSDGGSTELGPWLQEFLKKCRPDNVSSFRCTADNIWYLGDSGDQLPTSASTIRVLCRKFVGELGIQYGNTQLGESLDVAWYFRRSEYLQSLQRLVQLVAPCANLRTTIINTEKATLSQYSDILNQRRPINDNDLMTMLAFGFNTWASRTQGVFSSFRNQLPTSGSAAALCFLFVVDAMEMERGHQLTPSLKVHHRAFFAWLGRLEGCTIHADWLPFPQQQSQDPRFYKSRLIHIAYLLLAAAVCYDRRIMRFVTEETLKDEQAFRSIRPRLKDYLVLLIWVTHGTVVGQIDQTRLQKLGPGLKTTLSFLRLAASGTDILCELQAFVRSLWAAEPYIPPPAGASANHFFQCLSDAHAILIKDQRFSQPPPEPLSWQQPLSIPSISTQTLGFASPMFERVASELDQGKPVNAVEQAFARMLSFQLPTGATSVHVRELLDGYLEQWVNDAFCGDTDSTDQNTPTDQNPGPANPGTEDEWVRRLSEVGVSTVEADGNEVIINRHTDTERKYPYTYTKRVTAKALLLGEPASGSLTARRTFDSVWRRVLRVRCDGIEDASIVQISKKEWKVHRDTVG